MSRPVYALNDYEGDSEWRSSQLLPDSTKTLVPNPMYKDKCFKHLQTTPPPPSTTSEASFPCVQPSNSAPGSPYSSTEGSDTSSEPGSPQCPLCSKFLEHLAANEKKLEELSAELVAMKEDNKSLKIERAAIREEMSRTYKQQRAEQREMINTVVFERFGAILDIVMTTEYEQGKANRGIAELKKLIGEAVEKCMLEGGKLILNHFSNLKDELVSKIYGVIDMRISDRLAERGGRGRGAVAQKRALSPDFEKVQSGSRGSRSNTAKRGRGGRRARASRSTRKVRKESSSEGDSDIFVIIR